MKRSHIEFAKLASKKLSTGATMTLAVDIEEGLPSEFRIFKAGWNDTENGRFLFDAIAAQAVIAASKKWGVDNMIDLEHLSIDSDALNYDPDARGWCKLDLRDGDSGTELWAVSVSWTEDGAARLTEKRQRYISPYFGFDKKTKRVMQVVNIAIVSMPATHNAQELVAANVTHDLRKLAVGPSFEDVRTALTAAICEATHADPFSPDGPWVCDVFDASAVFQLDGKYFEVPYTYDAGVVTLGAAVEVVRSYAPIAAAAPAAPPAEQAPPPAQAANKKTTQGATVKISDFLKVCKALGIDPDKTSIDEAMATIKGEAPAADPDAKTEDAPPPAGDGGADEATESVEASAAAGRLAMQTTGKATVSEAMAELARTHKIAVDVEAAQAEVAADRAKLELDERTTIVKSLQVLGVETPATSGLANGKLCERLLKEPIAELRARHAQMLAARGGKFPTSPKPPQGNASLGLSERELTMCADLKIDPNEYAAQKASKLQKVS